MNHAEADTGTIVSTFSCSLCYQREAYRTTLKIRRSAFKFIIWYCWDLSDIQSGRDEALKYNSGCERNFFVVIRVGDAVHAFKMRKYSQERERERLDERLAIAGEAKLPQNIPCGRLFRGELNEAD